MIHPSLSTNASASSNLYRLRTRVRTLCRKSRNRGVLLVWFSVASKNTGVGAPPPAIPLGLLELEIIQPNQPLKLVRGVQTTVPDTGAIFNPHESWRAVEQPVRLCRSFTNVISCFLKDPRGGDGGGGQDEDGVFSPRGIFVSSCCTALWKKEMTRRPV